MSRLLVLTALFCAVALHAAEAGRCGPGRTRCSNGFGCYRAILRCDGEKDCIDGSDEQGCDALSSVALDVNATVTASMNYTAKWDLMGNQNSIEVLLCNSATCNLVALYGEYRDGRFGTTTSTGCNLYGRECAAHQTGVAHDADDWVYTFHTGEIAVVVQRRDSELAVWRPGHEDDVATVPVQEDFNQLVVRPYWMWTDFPVTFTDGAATA